MKKTKLLSAAIAAVMATCTFVGMIVTANAADDGKVHYSQDYQSLSSADWTTGTAGRFTPIIAESGENRYLTVAQDERRNNGTTLTSPNINITSTRFAVEFDIKLALSNDQGGTAFKINTEDGYLLQIKQADKTTNWTVNESQPISLEGSGYVSETDESAIDSVPWYHFVVSYGEGVTYLTIENSNGNKVLAQTIIQSGTKVGGITNMTFETSRHYADFAIDNVIIRNLNSGEIPDTKFYTATINTTRYATLTMNNGEVLYADVNGKIEIPLLSSGTEISYTLSKTGYENETGIIRIDNEDIMLDKELTMSQSDEKEKTIYFESDFGNAEGIYVTDATNRLSTMNLGSIILPELATFSMDLAVDKPEETQITWMLMNSEGKDVVGIQGTDDGLVVFTGFTGSSKESSGPNQSGAVGAFTHSAKIADTYVSIDPYKVSFVIDNVNDIITAKCGDAIVSIPLIEDTSEITSMQVGKYRNSSTVTIDNVMVTQTNPNFVEINGDREFAKIAGKTVTRQYLAIPSVILPNESFSWTVKDSTTDTEVEGVSISQDGLLSITDSVKAPCKVTITVTSDKSKDKIGELEVTIQDTAKLTPTIDGPVEVKTGDTVTYKVTKIIDEYGDDVTDYFTPIWSIDGVASTDSEITFSNITENGPAVVVSAVYKEDMVDLVFTENTVISDNTLTVSVPSGSKVMLWNSLKEMKPICLSQTDAVTEISPDVIAAIGSKTGKLQTQKAGEVTLNVTIGDALYSYDVTIVDNI